MRYGIYPQTGHYKVFKDKAALEQELKTKELEGYTRFLTQITECWLITG